MLTKYLGLTTVLILLLSFARPAEAVRCGKRLVNPGDSITRAVKYCPQPFWVERWQADGIGHNGYGHYVADTFEAWYLNFGSRKLMRRLLFRNGYLEREDVLDHGFNGRPAGNCNARELESAGFSLAEVFADCGPPDYEYSYPVTVYPSKRHHRGRHGPVVIYRHVWTYDLERQFDRELHFENGRLVQVNRLRD